MNEWIIYRDRELDTYMEDDERGHGLMQQRSHSYPQLAAMESPDSRNLPEFLPSTSSHSSIPPHQHSASCSYRVLADTTENDELQHHLQFLPPSMIHTSSTHPHLLDRRHRRPSTAFLDHSSSRSFGSGRTSIQTTRMYNSNSSSSSYGARTSSIANHSSRSSSDGGDSTVNRKSFDVHDRKDHGDGGFYRTLLWSGSIVAALVVLLLPLALPAALPPPPLEILLLPLLILCLLLAEAIFAGGGGAASLLIETAAAPPPIQRAFAPPNQ